MTRFNARVLSIAALAAGSSALALASDPAPQQFAAPSMIVASQGIRANAIQLLTQRYPGVRFHYDAGRLEIIYGVPMTPGATAQDAAENWLAQHGDVLGVAELELRPAWDADIRGGRFTVFAFDQLIDGVPVEYGTLRIMVLNGPTPRVAYVGARLAVPPAGGMTPVTLDPSAALAIAQADHADLPTWVNPELVAYFGDGVWTPAVYAWKVVGDNHDMAHRERLAYFVDAASGRILNVRNEILHVDVSGSVMGWGTPGTRPDVASNPEVLMPMPEIRATIGGGGNAFTSRNGLFTIANGGTADVSVSATTTTGRWVAVNDVSGGELSVSLTATPPGPADLVLNTGMSALDTAEINAFIGTTVTHNYIRDRATFTAIDTAIPANVNIAQTCNAYFDGSSINFYQAGGGCSNTAYSSVISHEYGHHIVARLGLGQGGFGEGFGDTVGMFIYDDGIIGREFSGANPVRNLITTTQTYPCTSGAVHTCGQILGGFWWDIRENFGASLGEPLAIDEIRDLHVAWAMITVGGTGSNFLNSAHPGTVIEILSVDDDDAVLENGTPHYNEVCAATAARGLACPGILPDNAAFIFEDDFEIHRGWTVGSATDDATTGIWTRVDPIGTTAQPEDDHTPPPGVMCFVTGQGPVGGAVGTADVDGGTTTLTSPAVNLAGIVDPQLIYYRWYVNNGGASPDSDTMLVQMSNNGTTWVTVETVGPLGTGPGWVARSIDIDAFITPSATTYLRFLASDLGAGSIVEAGVDDVRFYWIDNSTPCPADLNGDGSINLTDLAIILAHFGETGEAQPEDGDLDGDGDVDLTDLASLLAVFGTECP